ncbi:unnamed protein product [Ixodes hexagonus]
MSLTLLTVTFALILRYSSASSSYPELNPALQKYQDESLVFPLAEKWYMVYRNYESDPAFGGNAKCVRFTQTGPKENDAYPLLLEYTGHSEKYTVTLLSSPGYSTKNVMNFQAVGDDNSELTYTAFKDPDKCAVFRLPYAGEGACGLFVPESQLGNHLECCDFIFDLLCGTKAKYQIYDHSCKA